MIRIEQDRERVHILNPTSTSHLLASISAPKKIYGAWIRHPMAGLQNFKHSGPKRVRFHSDLVFAIFVLAFVMSPDPLKQNAFVDALNTVLARPTKASSSVNITYLYLGMRITLLLGHSVEIKEY